MATYNISIVSDPIGIGTFKVGSAEVSGYTQEEGVTVNMNANPPSGYRFLSWSTGGGVVSTERAYSFVMPSSDIEFIALFELIPTPSEEEQNSLFDTSCPKFLFIKDLSDRYFTGDVVDVTSTNYLDLLEEPIKFDAGTFKLERDEKYHGFNYEFGVDSLQCERNTVGYNYLKEQLILEGTDVDVKFLYGFGELNAFTVFYLGKVDMNEYEEIEDGDLINFSLVQVDFENTLQANFEVPQVVVPDKNVLLHSKVIPKRTVYSIPLNNDLSSYTGAFFAEQFDASNIGLGKEIIKLPSFTDYTEAYLFVNDGKEGDELELTPTYDFSVDSNKILNIIETGKYLVRAEEAGSYKINVKGTYGLKFRQGSLFTDPYPFQLKVVKVATDETTILSDQTFEASEIEAGIPFLGSVDVFLTFEESIDITLNINENLYVYYLIDVASSRFPEYTSPFPTITEIYSFPFSKDASAIPLEILAQTIAPTSQAKFNTPLDLLNGILTQASGVDYDLVISDFFGIDGCGERMYITNGFNIRGGTRLNNITEENASIKVDSKNLVNMFVNLFNMGWGIEYDEFKRELVRIEPTDYFYNDVEIISLSEVSNYTKKIDASKYYNQIEIGFKNYSKNRETDKANTLDDFHTKHTYQTPIKTNKNKLSVITDLTLSGYEIEILRRKQFIKDSSSTNSNFSEDEEIFGVFVSSTSPFTGGTYSNYVETEYTTILNDVLENYTTSGRVVYISSGGVSQSRTISTVFYSGSNTMIGFIEPLQGATGTGDITITISGNTFIQPETSGKIQAVEGLISPESSYNLRFTPKRMLQNWANLINGGFIGKAPSEKLLFKQGDGNINLSTFYAVGAECKFGDVDRTTVFENGDIIIGTPVEEPTEMSMGQGVFLFLPIKVTFTTNLTFEQLTDVKKCLRGQDETRNYGYITVTNPCGDVEKVYITSLEYSGVTDEATIEGYLKEL